MPEFHEKCHKAPRHFKLTAEQKARAESSPACNIPYAVARKHCKGYEENYERLLGFSIISYINCARNFKPEENPMGEEGWNPFAAHWTEMSMLAQEARYWRRRNGIETHSLDVPNNEGDSSMAESVPDHRGLEEATLEAKEEAAKTLRMLTAQQRAAVSLYWKDSMTLKEVGQRLKLTKEGVRKVIEGALMRLKMKGIAGGHNQKNLRHDNFVKIRANDRLEKNRKARAAKGQAVRSLAHQALGGVTNKGWYIGDPGQESLTGPFFVKAQAMSLLPPSEQDDGRINRIVQVARKARGEKFVLKGHSGRKLKRKGWKVLPVLVEADSITVRS